MDVEEDKIVRDFLGQELAVDDYVIASQGHELSIYQIIRITPKMVRVVRHGAKSRYALKGKLRYSEELLKVDNKLVTFYLMSH